MEQGVRRPRDGVGLTVQIAVNGEEDSHLGSICQRTSWDESGLQSETRETIGQRMKSLAKRYVNPFRIREPGPGRWHGL
jgi:hypothetical protein